MTTQFLEEGTAIMTLTEQVDEGNFGQRIAPIGSVGFIEDVDHESRGENIYSVVFRPSGVWGFWSVDEVARNAVVLDANDLRIPSKKTLEVAKLLSDLLEDFEIIDLDSRIAVPQEVTDTFLAGVKGTVIEKHAQGCFVRGLVLDRITFDDYNKMARAWGVGNIISD